MDEFSLKLGNRIKQLRQDKGISQEELAFAAGLNRAFIGELERGKKNATVRTIDKICVALDVTLLEFFSFELADIDVQSNALIKISSMLKQLDDNQANQIVDIIKRLISFKNS